MLLRFVFTASRGSKSIWIFTTVLDISNVPLDIGNVLMKCFFFCPFMLSDSNWKEVPQRKYKDRTLLFSVRKSPESEPERDGERVFLLNSTGWYESTVIKHRVSELFSDQPLHERKQSTIFQLLNCTLLIWLIRLCDWSNNSQDTFAFVCHFTF